MGNLPVLLGRLLLLVAQWLRMGRWQGLGDLAPTVGTPATLYKKLVFKSQPRISHAQAISTLLMAAGCLGLGVAPPAWAQTGPGCVSPAVWLKGDAGVTLSGTIVTGWASQTGTVTMSPGAVPGFPSLPIGVKAASTNYNPGLTFNNTNWGLATQRTYMDYAPTGIINKADGTMYVVANPSVANANAHLVGWYLDGDHPSLNMTANRPFFYTEGSSFAYGAPANSLQNNEPFMLGTSWTNGVTFISGNPDVRFNGNSDVSTLMFNTNTSALVDTPFRLGADTDWGGLTGEMLEVLVFETALTTPQKQRVESYLGIKYGITKVGDYLAGDGTTIWSTATNAGYTNSIIGIGRDDCQQLNQKQSKSTNGDTFVTIGNGTGIAATNAANTNSFAADKSFELVGDNGLAKSYATAYASSFTAAAPVYSMSRIWRVDETGTVGTVTISIPGDQAGTYLLVRNDATFTTSGGTTEIPLLPDGNGNLTAQVDFTDGQYFTFARPAFSPGCVNANLLLWYKPTDGLAVSGSTVTGWTDQVSGITVTPASNATGPDLAPASALFNYNPSLTFDGTNDIIDYRGTRFIGATSPGTLFGAALAEVNGGYENLADLGIDNPHMGLLGGTQIMWLNGSGGPFPATGGPVKDAQMQVWGYYWNSGAPGQGQRLDGAVYSYPTSASSNDVGNYAGAGTFSWGIGGYNDRIVRYEPWTGNISEVILYDRNLTEPEKDKVDTYLAVKYGTTLTHNYVSAAGTTIYDISSFSANVTGIGREDCQALNQKQSKSVNAGSRLLIGAGNTITTTNANHPDSFTGGPAYIVFGDNGGTGSTSIAAGGPCAPPPSADKFTNLAYKVTETGDAPSARLNFNASGFGFNSAYPVYMQVATDAAFTNIITSVPFSLSSGTATGTYDFPANSTRYIRFAGNTTSLANICVAPKKQTFHWNGWWYGTKQKTLLPNFIPQSLSATADMSMSVTVTDGSSLLLYRPTVDWWPVFDGLGLFIPRNDNTTTENQLITTRMQFRQGTSTSVVAAQTVDFIIRDVDGWIGGRDIVRVYGKVGGTTVTPQLSRYKPLPFNALQLNYQSDPQQAIGSDIPWDLGAWANVYVSFTDPVEEVFVEYRKDNTYAFKVYNDIRIGAVSVTCKAPTPKEPLADNVYVYKEVSPNPVKEGDEATYKFTVQNTNCAAKTINFTDNLSGGLVWRDSSFVTSETITVGTVNAYGNGTTLTSTMTVPPGTSYFYASVTGTQGVRNNQGSYTVQGGTGTTYLTDDPSTTGATAQPTALTIIANDPNANLTVSKTASVATSPQNGTVTYTITVNNPNGAAVETVIQDNLPTSATYVGGTLTGAGSATVNAYAGESTLTIRGFSAPPGTSVLTIVANVSSSSVGSVLSNVAQIKPDLNSGYRQIGVMSSVANTTIIGAPTALSVSNPPVQNATAGGTSTGNAATELAPQGGTAPYTYSNDTGNASCSAVAGATQLPPANLTVTSGGAYSVTAPATPGTYYYCIKVCDSSTPTPQCITKTYTLSVAAAAGGTGTLDCSTAQIMGIAAGTASNGTLKLTITVTTPGTMPVTVSGSGMSASPSPYVINATTTGVQTFYIPISYSGAAFGPTTITVGGAGTCSPDLSLVVPKTVSTSVLNLGPACSPASAATLVK